MNGSIKGIIIRATDYREKDKIIDIFTPEGIVPVSVKGVRAPTAKLKNLSGVLTYGDFSFQEGKGRKVLSGGEVVDNFFPCWTDPKKYAAAMLCIELTEKLFRREEDLREEFVVLLKSIGEIAYGGSPLSTALWFFVKIAEKIGCDYSAVYRADPNAFQVLSLTADGSETGVVGTNETELFSALKLLLLCYKNEFGIVLRSLGEAEKLFYRL